MRFTTHRVLCFCLCALMLFSLIPFARAATLAPVKYETLRLGDRSDEVKTMQKALKKLLYYPSSVDGIFGMSTEISVKAFQSAHKLPVDGLAGNKTLTLLYSKKAKPAPSSTPTPKPSPTAKPTSSPVSKPTPTPHPVLGSIEETYTYKKNGLDIVIQKRKIGNNVIFLADVKASIDRLFTNTVAKPGQSGGYKTTSAQAKAVGAVLAINGDMYNYLSKESNRGKYGIVARGGILYRDIPCGRDGLALYADGRMEVFYDKDTTGSDLILDGAKEIFTFGPMLVKDGKRTIPKTENVHPRTAIGQVAKDHWVLLIVEGRQQGYSVGMTYKQMSMIFLEKKCTVAYNLDGGGSSAIYLEGEGILNRPSDGKERSVTDIIYFK